MAKKHKTRQEKIIADLRRKVAMQEAPPARSVVTTNMYSIPSVKISSPIASSQQPEARSHAYVLSDLKKTGILTIIAIAAQIGLYFALMR